MSFSKMLAVALTVLKILNLWDGSWGWIVMWVIIGKFTGLIRAAILEDAKK